MDITTEAIQALSHEDFAVLYVLVQAEAHRRRTASPLGHTPAFVLEVHELEEAQRARRRGLS